MSYNNYKILNSEKIKSFKTIQEIKLSDNIFLIKSDFCFDKQNSMDMLSKVDGLLMTINLKGEVKHKSHLNDFSLDIKDNMTSINLIQTEQGLNTIKKDNHVQSLHIIFKKSFLQENLLDTNNYIPILEFFDRKTNAKNLKTSLTNIKNQIIVNEIYHQKYSGSLNKLFLQSKVLELFFNEFQEMESINTSKNSKVKFSQYDKEAIYHAKDIMLNNIKKPPSISSLAKLVRLNEFKLKTGFNMFFNTSPYKMLHEYRMEKAKELLQSADMNVSEVSQEVGYKYIHNFSKVFSKRFGVRPKDLMKSRKYYY